jgi:hypothetical protein
MKAQWNCCKETGVQRPNQVPSAGIMVNSKCEATSAVITKCPGKQPGKITGPMLNLVDQICTHILAIGIKENLELTSLTTHKLIHATFEGSHSPWSCKCKKDCSFLVDYPRGGRFDPSICPTMPVTCTEQPLGSWMRREDTDQRSRVELMSRMYLQQCTCNISAKTWCCSKTFVNKETKGLQHTSCGERPEKHFHDRLNQIILTMIKNIIYCESRSKISYKSFINLSLNTRLFQTSYYSMKCKVQK